MGKINFCSVGCGDCTVIQATSGTYLIDCHKIDEHKNLLPSSKKLRGVFITHQHTDHFSGLDYLKRNGYSIDNLIYSPYERRNSDNSVTLEEWNDFKRLRDHFVNKGTKTNRPYRQTSWDKKWWSPGGVEFEILAPFEDLATSSTRELHDASLVVGVYAPNKRRFLLTGDASDASLNKIANNTKNYCNDVLRASHHGSNNNADLDFVKKANAKYTVVSTKSGVYENVPGSTAMQRYRNNTKEKVYRTDQDGSISWSI